ncbi:MULTISPECIES: hypothetical protein [Bacillus]|uniref:hypothetical protein n=1 Tax=Bacillus TaxID=1386 RepID=UPI001585D8A8|nr:MULTISPECIES: hypothetical protein [Bacillus]
MLDLEKGDIVRVITNDCSECKKGKNDKYDRIELFFGEFELINVRVVTPKYVN